MAPAPKFNKDEKALCFHHELLYEAKVIDVRLVDPNDKKSAYEYKVHYKGWKSTWDDWVPEDRLRKLTDENQELARSLKKEMDALAKQKATPKPISTNPTVKRKDGSARGSEERGTGPGKKRGRDFDTEREEAFNSKPAVRIVMPDALKSILVDDWENITKSYQLVRLPALYPVNRILDDYINQERPKCGDGTAASDLLDEVVAGLKEYFNRSLGRILLYKYERGQYEDLLGRISNAADDLSGRQLADVYGAEHLLRLFVSLPELIAQTNMDQQSAGRLREELHKVTTWLAKMDNINKYLSTPYENQGSDYMDRFRGKYGTAYWKGAEQERKEIMLDDAELQSEQASGRASIIGRRLDLGPIVKFKCPPRVRQSSVRLSGSSLVSAESSSQVASGNEGTRRQSNRLRRIV